ncbi:MAG: hypothetical protein KJ023_11060 [Burkholderiaceae bacterium]|nr:hypothetical protein [Burkholderiaceae bacterium]
MSARLSSRVPFLRRFAAAIGLASVALAAAAAPQAVVSTPQVRAELVAHAPEGVAAGKPLELGLLIEHAPHWHTYWKNPGDSGLPTTLAFTLPAGFNPGEIRWPTPARLPIGPLMNFGYEGRVLLPVAVQVPAGFAGEALEVKLRADWLVCKEVCIPRGGDFARTRPAVRAGVQVDDFTHGELGFDAAGLQHHPDAVAEVAPGPRRVDAEYRYRTGGGDTESFEDLDGGGLAGPVLPEQRVHLARFDSQVEAIDGHDIAVTLRQIADVDDGHVR